MKVEVEIKKSYFVVICSLLIIIAGVYFAIATTANGVTHGTNDLIPSGSCSTSDVLRWSGSTWMCTSAPTTNTDAESKCNNDRFLRGDGQCRSSSEIVGAGATLDCQYYTNTAVCCREDYGICTEYQKYYRCRVCGGTTCSAWQQTSLNSCY